MVSQKNITQFPRDSQNSTSQSLWFPKNQWIETTANSAWFRCCSGAGIELCSTSPLHGTDFEPPFQWIQMENIWMEQLNGNNMWMDTLWYTMVIYGVFFMAKLIQRLLSWHLPCSISQTLNEFPFDRDTYLFDWGLSRPGPQKITLLIWNRMDEFVFETGNHS